MAAAPLNATNTGDLMAKTTKKPKTKAKRLKLEKMHASKGANKPAPIVLPKDDGAKKQMVAIFEMGRVHEKIAAMEKSVTALKAERDETASRLEKIERQIKTLVFGAVVAALVLAYAYDTFKDTMDQRPGYSTSKRR